MENKYNNICFVYKNLMDEECNIIQKTDTIVNNPANISSNNIKLDCEMLKKLYDNCLTFKIEKTKIKQKINIDDIFTGYRYRK